MDLFALHGIQLNPERLKGPKEKLVELLYTKAHVGTHPPRSDVVTVSAAKRGADQADKNGAGHETDRGEERRNGNQVSRGEVVNLTDTGTAEEEPRDGPHGDDDDASSSYDESRQSRFR